MRASEISQAENCNSGHVEEGVDANSPVNASNKHFEVNIATAP